MQKREEGRRQNLDFKKGQSEETRKYKEDSR